MKNDENVLIITVKPGSNDTVKFAFKTEYSLYQQKYSLLDKTDFYGIKSEFIKILEDRDGEGLRGYFVLFGQDNGFQFRIYLKNKYFNNSFESFKKIAILISPSLSEEFSKQQ